MPRGTNESLYHLIPHIQKSDPKPKTSQSIIILLPITQSTILNIIGSSLPHTQSHTLNNDPHFRTLLASTMASTQCFLHHHALASPSAARSSSQRQAVTAKPSHLVCRAQQKQAVPEDDGVLLSRRLALTVLIGAAAVGSKVSPADAAYGEAGIVYDSPCLYQNFY